MGDQTVRGDKSVELGAGGELGGLRRCRNDESLTVNGEKKVPDSEGNVDLTIDKLEVDESLDADSTNPVQNKTVAAKFQEVEAGTVFGMSAEVSDDESSVRLALTNKSGAEIASVDIPAGSGGGGESSTTKIVLLAETDKKP